MTRRDYHQEAMEAMVDLSLSDLDAVKKAAGLLERSSSNDITKAFTLSMAAWCRAEKRKQAQVPA